MSKLDWITLVLSVVAVVAGGIQLGSRFVRARWWMLHADDRTRRTVAWHEAGHALMAMLVDPPKFQFSVVRLTLDGGSTDLVGSIGGLLPTSSDMINCLAVCFGGMAAEKIANGEHSIGCEHDLKEITKLAYRMVTQSGMSDWSEYIDLDDCSSERTVAIETEVSNVICTARHMAERTLAAFRVELGVVANELLARRKMTWSEVRDIVDGRRP